MFRELPDERRSPFVESLTLWSVISAGFPYPYAENSDPLGCHASQFSAAIDLFRGRPQDVAIKREEPNRAGQWLTPAELNEVLLNRYPAAGTELREALAVRYGVAVAGIVGGAGGCR